MIKGEYMMEVGRGKGRRLRLRRGNEANNLLMRRELSLKERTVALMDMIC